MDNLTRWIEREEEKKAYDSTNKYWKIVTDIVCYDSLDGQKLANKMENSDKLQMC